MSDLTPNDATGLESWISRRACRGLSPEEAMDAFFVAPGHVLREDVIMRSRRCPVRQECIKWAYEMDHVAGYFGALSRGQRQQMTLEEALAFAKADTEALLEEDRALAQARSAGSADADAEPLQAAARVPVQGATMAAERPAGAATEARDESAQSSTELVGIA